MWHGERMIPPHWDETPGADALALSLSSQQTAQELAWGPIALLGSGWFSLKAQGREPLPHSWESRAGFSKEQSCWTYQCRDLVHPESHSRTGQRRLQPCPSL